MPAGSKELTAARREEIVDACAQLYETMPFKKITLGVIGEKTSFTRTSIYNYFRTKEEIFLALLEREYAAWAEDMERLAASRVAEGTFAVRFSALLEKRKCMLKLLSMNVYDLEAGSRIENLVSFKRAYGRSMRAVSACLQRHCPHVTEEDAQRFIYAFYPFLFGIYPYTESGEKQRRAMAMAGVPHRACSVTQIAAFLVEKLLGGGQGGAAR